MLAGVLIGTVLLCASPVPAEDGQGDSILQPQRWRNAVWALGLFVVLLVVLGRLAWKPVLRAIQIREQEIAETITDAERQRTESEELLAEYRARLAAAQGEAAKLIERSRHRAETDRQEILDRAREAADVATAEACEQIERAKRDSQEEICRTSAELATDVAEKIIAREICPEDHRRLVEQSLKQLEQG